MKNIIRISWGGQSSIMIFPLFLEKNFLNHINQDFLNKNYNVFQIELKH